MTQMNPVTEIRKNPYPPHESMRVNAGALQAMDFAKPPTAFRTLFESSRINDFASMADTIDEDCEWVLMPNRKTFKGKKDVVELCMAGKFASDKTPEIILDLATPQWGVFEYVNRGTITKELSGFAASSGSQIPSDPSTLVGQQYEVPVCFVYHVNSKGRIYLLHEYLDLASLMKQFK
jgi:hypothetical protein